MEATAESVLDAQPVAQLRIAGFWRRLAAFLLDALFLGVAGFVLGSILGEALAPAGTPARLIGLVVLLPYLGILGSRIGKGQTLGKRLLGIRIVAVDGGLLSPGRAFLRAAMLGLPWMLNGIRFASFGPVQLATIWIASILVFGVGGAIVGTFVLQRRTRQAFHDLAVGSWVVVADEAAPVPPPRSTRRPLVASLAWIGLVAAVSAAFVGGSTNLVGSMTGPVGERLSSLHGVASWMLSRPTTHTKRLSGESSSVDSLKVVVWFTGPEEEIDRIEREVALTLLDHPEAGSVDLLDVRIVRGWDVGIASSTTTKSAVLSPAAWLERLER